MELSNDIFVLVHDQAGVESVAYGRAVDVPAVESIVRIWIYGQVDGKSLDIAVGAVEGGIVAKVTAFRRLAEEGQAVAERLGRVVRRGTTIIAQGRIGIVICASIAVIVDAVTTLRGPMTISLRIVRAVTKVGENSGTGKKGMMGAICLVMVTTMRSPRITSPASRSVSPH